MEGSYFEHLDGTKVFVPEKDLVRLWRDPSRNEQNTEKIGDNEKKSNSETEIVDIMDMVNINEYNIVKTSENPLFRKVNKDLSSKANSLTSEDKYGNKSKKSKISRHIKREEPSISKPHLSYISEYVKKTVGYVHSKDNEILEYSSTIIRTKSQVHNDVTKVISASNVEAPGTLKSIFRHGLSLSINTLEIFLSAFLSLLVILSCKYTWKIGWILLKVFIDVFLYLVLACSTIMITIILNTYDTYLSNNQGQSNFNDSDEDNVVEQINPHYYGGLDETCPPTFASISEK